MRAGRNNAPGQNNALAANAGVRADVTAQLIESGMVQRALPRHADFPGIMPEVAENTATAYVDVVLQNRITNVGEVRDKDSVTEDAVLDFHGITDHTVITDGDVPAQVRIGANGTVGADAYKALNNRTGFDDGTLPQLQHATDNGLGVNAAVVSSL